MTNYGMHMTYNNEWWQNVIFVQVKTKEHFELKVLATNLSTYFTWKGVILVAISFPFMLTLYHKEESYNLQWNYHDTVHEYYMVDNGEKGDGDDKYNAIE